MTAGQVMKRATETLSINAIGPIFNTDGLNKPHSGNTGILENWTFVSVLGEK